MANKKNKPAKAASENEAAKAETVIAEVIDNPTVARQKRANELKEAAKKRLAAENKTKEAKAAEEKSAQEKASKVEEKDNRPIFKDNRGLKFRFKKSTPKTLNIDGKAELLSDIIENEEIMLELVNGNSNFLEQIH